MSDDLIQLLIYVAIGVAGVIASAYKNKMKKQQTSGKVQSPNVPPTLPADPSIDFPPELRPLLEMFDIPKPQAVKEEEETVESGQGVEERGIYAEYDGASAELAGMNAEEEGVLYEKDAAEVKPEMQSFAEGQSAIPDLSLYEETIAEEKYDYMEDDIASGEIVSVEAEELSRRISASQSVPFNLRKAIIYSEILKRKEF
jgi:hypothetical protein